MLILTRKPGESLWIGDNVKITIVELKGHQIRIGIDAPKDLRIYREEIYLQILEENKKAAAEAAKVNDSGLDGLTAVWRERHGAGFGGSSDGEEDKPKEGIEKKSSFGGLSTFSVNKPGSKDPEVMVKKKRGKKDE